jgi:hypothetical protein
MRERARQIVLFPDNNNHCKCSFQAAFHDQIILPRRTAVRLAYQPPASSNFLSEQISHHQPGSRTFLSEQISTSHQPNEQAAKEASKLTSPGCPG